MTELSAISDKVVAIISVITQRDDISEASSRENTPEWDSLKHIDVIFAVEDEFDIAFDDETLSKLNSVASITKQVARSYAS